MKKRNFLKRVLLTLIISSTVLSAVGCGGMSSEDLMKDVTPSFGNNGDFDNKSAETVDFAIKLMQNTVEDGKNTLLSPLSVLTAMAMTFNGAEGNTLAQFEETVGVKRDELNGFLSEYLKNLPEGEKYKLNVANSIWVRDDGFTVNGDFLQKNADSYRADFYKTPFDNSTLKDINNWVERETDGMIKNVLDNIPSAAVMYLINALAFEAEWNEVYKKTDVSEGIFHTAGGEKQPVDFMYGAENKYLFDGDAEGFIKYYSGKKYAFAALLPREDMPLSEYVASLSGEKLLNTLSDAVNVAVYSAIPKFETEYDCDMSGILADMGIKDAFDGLAADFSGLGTAGGDNLFINRVIHKTFISVAEKGTKAGAVTMVEVNTTGADSIGDEKHVVLDRPFLYMIIDCETNIPVFMGTLNSVK